MLTAVDVLSALRRVVDEAGPDITLFRFRAETGIGRHIVYDRWGNWTNLRRAAGLPVRNKPRPVYSDDDLLAELHATAISLDKFPTVDEFNRASDRSWNTYARRFGDKRAVSERYRDWLERQPVGVRPGYLVGCPCDCEPTALPGEFSTNRLPPLYEAEPLMIQPPSQEPPRRAPPPPSRSRIFSLCLLGAFLFHAADAGVLFGKAANVGRFASSGSLAVADSRSMRGASCARAALSIGDSCRLPARDRDRSGRPVMLSRWIGLTLLACGMGISAVPVHAAAKPVVTNKLRFRIPFKFDAAALQRMNARELQLFVSQNRGVNWELAQTITPQDGRFEFQAPADGEYWFAVRTVDGFGAVHPSGQSMEAGLIVVVDTLPPSLALNLEQTTSGKLELTWSASDANLDSTTLKLESQQPGQEGWQTVSVIPNHRGTTSWTVPQSGMVAIRGSIADLAGNAGKAQTQLQAVGGGKPQPRGPEIRQPIAEGEPAETAPLTADPQFGGITIQPRANPEVPRRGPAIVRAMPPTTQQFISDSPAARPDVTQERWSTPPVAPDSVTYHMQGRERVVKSLQFQIGYKVDDVGPSGVGGVELFITQDRGRQWYRYGEDLDRVSPMEVTVPRDGEYGFAVRVRSGAGLGQEPPQPNEPPAIMIVVDQTPPRLELLPIQQGRGPELNQILIRWKVSETRPSDKPISLYYAASPAGPWEPISGWRADTGSFAWTAGPGIPSQFYIRIAARDAAGNVATAETPQPILVDLSRPTARIVDVEVPGIPR